MNSVQTTVNIESIEELTLYSLDRSIEGLRQLRADSLRCAELLQGNPAEFAPQFGALAQSLRDFLVFEGDIVSLFQVDPDCQADAQGSLKAAEEQLGTALNQLGARFESWDFEELEALLKKDLPGALQRFEALLPLLRDYIDVQYVRTSS